MKPDDKGKHLSGKGTYASNFLRKEINEVPGPTAYNQIIKDLKLENATLEKEVDDLKQQLKVSVSRIPHLHRLILPPDSAEPKDSAQVSLNDLLLSDIEVKEAVIKACWLARYWTLASRFNICSAIASAQAAYWSQHAPSDQILHDSARRISAALGCSQESSSEAFTARRKKSGRHASNFHGALVTDVVELERALLRIEALGVVRDVRSQITRMVLYGGGLGGGGGASGGGGAAPFFAESGGHDVFEPAGDSQSLLSDLEADEIQFQKAWLTYFWGRAALMGILPQVSRPHAEFLSSCLTQPPAPTDFKTLARVSQELNLYGIDQELWRRR